jgi:hypothetical protein
VIVVDVVVVDMIAGVEVCAAGVDEAVEVDTSVDVEDNALKLKSGTKLIGLGEKETLGE